MKKQSVLPSIALIVFLVISTLGYQTWIAHSVEAQGTSLKIVNPLTGDNLFSFTNAQKGVGDTFVVNITVADVTDLSVWQIYLTWDPSLLDFVSYELPPDNVFAGQTVINASEVGTGYVVCDAALGPGMNSFNGTGTLCQITLKITQPVSTFDQEVSCGLTLANLGTDTFLIDSQMNDIPFTAFNGVYDYKNVTNTIVKIVNPLTGDGWFNFTTQQKKVGDTFVINITVVNAVYLDIWQIKLTWNASFLAFASRTIPSDNVFGDNLLVGSALETGSYICGAVTTASTFSGSGTLCQITLELTSMPSEFAPEISCDLGFSDIDYQTFLCAVIGGEPFSYYPFVAQEGFYDYKGHVDVTVSQLDSAKTVIGRGYGGNVSLTVQNLADFPETFNVTTLANATAVSVLSFSIDATSSEGRVFVWDTSGFGYGNYRLEADADVVPYEENTTNNNCTCAYLVHIGVPADVSGSTPGVYDGVTNMKDIAYLVFLFNTRPNSPIWDPNTDVNNDGVCNFRDIAIAVAYFNQHE